MVEVEDKYVSRFLSNLKEFKSKSINSLKRIKIDHDLIYF